MKRMPLILVLLLSIQGLCSAQPAAGFAAFGGQTLNPADGMATFNATFAPDGRTVYFSRATAGWAAIHIYVAQYSDGAWSTPRQASFSQGEARDTDPYLSRDGKTMHFASDRIVKGETYKPFQYRIWQMKKTGAGWTVPILSEDAINSLAPVLFISFDKDGNAYFLRSGPERGLYTATRKADGTLGPASPLTIAGANAPMDPIVSGDGNHLYFIDSPNADSKERFVYVSHRGSSGWSAPQKLPQSINASDKHIATGLSPDDAVLFYASKATDAAAQAAQLEIRCHGLEGIVEGIVPTRLESLRECRRAKP